MTAALATFRAGAAASMRRCGHRFVVGRGLPALPAGIFIVNLVSTGGVKQQAVPLEKA